MKVLLDVCTPVQIRRALPGHDVRAAAHLGWRKLSNGALLDAAEAASFDLLIACDKNIRHQQNLAGRTISILELWTNHRPTLELYLPEIGAAALAMQPGEYRALARPR